MVAFKLQKHLTRTDLGKMTIDPRPFFQPALLNIVEPKCWYLKNEGVGWKHGGASLQIAHHNLTWHFYLLSKQHWHCVGG